MAFTLDPAQLLGNAIQGAIGSPVLIGLSSPQAKIPNFVIGIMPEENVQTSITLPSFQLQAGDYFLKTARNPGIYTFTLVLSDVSNLPSAWLTIVSNAVQLLSGSLNSIGNFGAVIPNFTGATSSYTNSQIRTLHAIKDGAQPVLLLNSFVTLGSVSITNPFLNSNWYVENISILREESDNGVVCSVTLRELLTKRETSGAKNLIINFANEILGPGAGSSLSSLI